MVPTSCSYLLTKSNCDADKKEIICSIGDYQRTSRVNVEEYNTINVHKNALTLKRRMAKEMCDNINNHAIKLTAHWTDKI